MRLVLPFSTEKLYESEDSLYFFNKYQLLNLLQNLNNTTSNTLEFEFNEENWHQFFVIKIFKKIYDNVSEIKINSENIKNRDTFEKKVKKFTRILGFDLDQKEKISILKKNPTKWNSQKIEITNPTPKIEKPENLENKKKTNFLNLLKNKQKVNKVSEEEMIKKIQEEKKLENDCSNPEVKKKKKKLVKIVLVV